MCIVALKITYGCPKCKRTQIKHYDILYKQIGDLSTATTYDYCEFCSQDLSHEDIRSMTAKLANHCKGDLF